MFGVSATAQASAALRTATRGRGTGELRGFARGRHHSARDLHRNPRQRSSRFKPLGRGPLNAWTVGDIDAAIMESLGHDHDGRRRRLGGRIRIVGGVH